MAFKILYFFIAFILFTFGLLYLYYKLDQKEQAEEQRAKRAKGVFYGEPNQQTFFDFLAGQVDDENYLVNPNARTNSSASLNSVKINTRAPKAKEQSAYEVLGMDKLSTVYYQ